MAYCELFFFWTVKLHCLLLTDKRLIGKLSGLNGELTDDISLCLSFPAVIAVMRLKEPNWLFKRCSPSCRSSREIRGPRSSQQKHDLGAFQFSFYE